MLRYFGLTMFLCVLWGVLLWIVLWLGIGITSPWPYFLLGLPGGFVAGLVAYSVADRWNWTR